MVFWIGILVGGLFAWLAIKIGFYEIWTMLFNIMVSVYLAVFLGPVIAKIIPGLGQGGYSNALAILAVGVVTFLILYGISYILLTGQFTISFPKVLDILGAGLLGFLTGFLVWSFVSLLICVAPVSQNACIKEIGFDRQSQQANISYVSWWCDRVNTMVFSKDNYLTAEQGIDNLLKSFEDNTSQESEVGHSNALSDPCEK